jgi:outer membrane protein TolC
MQIEQDVQTRIVELQLAQRSLEIQERRVTLAEEAFAISLETYRMGGGSFDELQNASTSVAQTRRQALQARHALERELISLERTLGVSLQDAGIAVRTGD